MIKKKNFTRLLPRFTFILFIVLFSSYSAQAQLDVKHYLPPCYAGTNNNYFVGEHWAVITTPSTKPIQVRIEKGDGSLVDQIEVSRSNPVRYLIGEATYDDPNFLDANSVVEYPLGVIDYSKLNTVLVDQGLIFTSDDPFYVNVRHKTAIHGSSITLKGRSALGTSFRSGHIFSRIYYTFDVRSHFISVMATEDNTTVTFSDIKTNTITSNTNQALNVSGSITKTLNAGESYVIACNFAHLSASNVNDFNGTKVTSDKPIAVNSGSWTGGAAQYDNATDIGMDQIVPEDIVGTEYIVFEGKGNDMTERPIVVVTEPGTDIFVNGVKQNSSPLDAGDYFPISSSNYTADGTMFIKTNKRTYVYQTISGSSASEMYQYATVGMNFIPPLTSSGIREVDIPQVEQLGSGVITILAQFGAKVYLDGGTSALTGGKPVQGKPEWVSYTVTGLSGDVKVISDKAICVALVTQSSAVGAAGYFSGFTKMISPLDPNVVVESEGNVSAVCENYEGAIVLRNSGDEASVYRWFDKTTGELLSENSYLNVEPQTSNTYLLKAYFRDENLESILNGGFEQGYLFFDTDDTYRIDYTIDQAGDYLVDSETKRHNSSFLNIDDHTSGYGNMMVVYGNTAKDTIWKNEVPVDPNEDYIFSVWGRKLKANGDELLQFYINGEAQGSAFRLDNADEWQNMMHMWNSGTAPMARIAIVNLNTDHSGMFALDDVSFVRAVMGEAEFTVNVLPKIKYDLLDPTTRYCEGHDFQLDVSNGSEELFTYQWLKDGKEITEANVSGKTSHILKFTSPNAANQGHYTCRIIGTSECGHDEETLETELVMDGPISIVTPPLTETICEGEGLPIDLEISGGYNQIQWYRNDVLIPGAMFKSYTYTGSKDDGNVKLECVATGGCDPVTWVANLTVLNKPEIVSPLHAESVCDGEKATLSLEVEGAGNFHYTWYNGSTELGQTDVPSYSFVTESSYNGAPFRVLISNDLGCPVIEAKIDKPFHVKPGIKIRTEPADDIVCVGVKHTFRIELYGSTKDYSFQWYFNDLPLSGETNTILTLDEVTLEDDGKYKVVVQSECDDLEFEANLTVNQKPSFTSALVPNPVGPYCIGNSVNLSATHSGIVSQYVWRHDGTEKVSSKPSLLIDPLTETDFGFWELDLSNDCGSVQKSVLLERYPELIATISGDQEVCDGEDVGFEVFSNGIDFQWYFGNDKIEGADQATLNLSDVTPEDAGVYRCEVTGPCNTVWVEAQLVVGSVVNSITDAKGCIGSPFEFTIETTGTYTYQWYKDNQKLDGATSATLSIDKLSLDDSGIYKCITNSVCGEQVFTARLNVFEITSITEKLEPVEKCVGDELIMEIRAAGDNNEYVWMCNDKELTEFRNMPILHIHELEVKHAGTYTYKVMVVGECEEDYSEAQVIVHPASNIEADIKDQVLCEGSPLVLEVNAVGYELSFDWQRNDEDIALGTGPKLDLGNSTEAMEGVYTVKIRSTQCKELSTSASIDIRKPLVVNSGLMDVELCEQDELRLTLDVEGDDLQYSWRKDLLELPGFEKEFSILNVGLTDAGTYTCQVTTANNCGSQLFTSDVSVRPSAKITLNPSPVDICEGEEAVFTADGDVYGNKTYQWYADGVKVGGNSNELRFVPDPLTDNGKNYYCEIWGDACKHAFTSSALLTVNQEVRIETAPKAIRVGVGATAEFTVSVTGTGPYTYQWEKQEPGSTTWTRLDNNTIYSGTTTSKLTVSNVDLTYDKVNYRCVVSNTCGSTTSDPAELTVDAKTKILLQPQPVEICQKNDAVFKVDAAGASPRYQWRYRKSSADAWADLTEGLTFVGVDTKQLTVKNVTPGMSGYEFYCVVIGDGFSGTEATDVAELTVKADVVVSPINNLEICPEESATLVAAATGAGTLTYKWFYNGTETAIGATLVLNEGNALEGTYRCVVSGECASGEVEAKITHFKVTEITSPLVSAAICLGTPADLKVTADYEEPVTYNWFKDGLPILGALSQPFYTIDADDTSDAGTYEVEVSGKCGIDNSRTNVELIIPIQIENTWKDEYAVCEGENLDLRVEVSGTDPVYSWYQGTTLLAENGPLLSLKNIDASKAGAYKCVVENGCTPTEISTTVRINKPTLITDGLDAVIQFCQDVPALLSVKAEGEELSYSWSFKDEEIGTASAYTIGALNEATTGTYTCVVSGICGTLTTKGDVQMIPNYKLDEGLKDTTVCEGASVEFQVFAIGEDLDYQWSNDRGDDLSVFDGKSVLSIGKAVAGAPVEYRCEVSARCGDNQITKSILVVNETTRIIEALSPQEKCEGEEVEFLLKVQGGVKSYKWTKDGVDLGNDAALLDLGSIVADQGGVYACSVEGVCGNRYASAFLRVKEATILEKTFEDSETLCAGEELTIRLEAAGEDLSYQWFLNDNLLVNNTTELKLTSVSVADAGEYKCLVHGSCGDLKDSIPVTVNAITELREELADQEVCEGNLLQMQMKMNGANLSYHWEKDGVKLGDNSHLEIGAVGLSDAGEYLCKVTGTCGDAESKALVDVKKRPNIITQPIGATLCENSEQVSFVIEVEGDDIQLQWRKDGVNLEGQTYPVLNVFALKLQDAGLYDCVVTSPCGDYIESNKAELIIIPLSKIVNQSDDQTVCEGDPVVFQVEASGVNLRYQWRKDGVNIPNAATSQYSIASATTNDIGRYDCAVVADCSDTIYNNPITLSVGTLPSAPIFGRMALCAGEERVVYLTADIADYEYSWGVDGGTSLDNINPRRVNVTWDEIEKGNLHLYIKTLETGCQNQVDSLVTLWPLPNVTLDEFAPRGSCSPAFKLEGGLPFGGIYWVEDQPQKLFDPSVGPGVYDIKYSYTDENGCSGSASGESIKVMERPQVRAMEDQTIGVCQELRLTAQSDLPKQEWSPKTDLLNSYSNSPLFVPGTSQRFVVKVVDEFGCEGHDYVNVRVAPGPSVRTIGDTIIGQCKQIELIGQIEGEGVSVSWTPELGLIKQNDLNTILDQPVVGVVNYKVTATDAYGCEAVDSVKVTTMAQIELGDDQFACEGDVLPVDLNGLTSFYWSDGSNDRVRSLEEPGEYVLRAEDQFGCEDSTRFVIHPTPQINLKDTFIYEGQTIILDPQLEKVYGPYSYSWQDGSILDVYEASEEGTYSVSVMDDLGCWAEALMFLDVKEKHIAAPNAFLPDNTGENNRFYLKDINFVDNFGMYIYDRWGTLVYKTHEIGYNGGWNGTHNGKACPAGAYVWVVMVNGKLQEKGNVILVR